MSSEVGYLVRDFIKKLDDNLASICDKDGIKLELKFMRRYVSGTVDKKKPLFASVTCGTAKKEALFQVRDQMLLNCLKTSDMSHLKFKYFFEDKEFQIEKVEGDNVFTNGKTYNGGCLVEIKYPNVVIKSSPKVEPKPTYIPEDSNGNKMQWRSLFIENAVCRATGREYIEFYNDRQKFKPYGWWDSNYNFLSKEAAEDRVAPGGVKAEYTIEGKTYTDIKWEQHVREKNVTPYCDIIKNGETGEGHYTCNNGEYFISVEAVTIQNPNITGEFTTLAALLPEGKGSESVIPRNFGLQIIANDNGNLTYLGRCPIINTEREKGKKKLILRGKHRDFTNKLNVIDNPKEIVVANDKNVLRDITDDTPIGILYGKGKFINLNENIVGEYYGLKERGLYFFVVHIGEVPLRNNFTRGSNKLKLRL